MTAPLAAPRLAALALVVLASLAPSPAAAEEARWNVNVNVGPLFVLGQPPPLGGSSDQLYATAGLDLRLGFELQVHERLGIELAYGPGMLFRTSGITGQQNLLIGARIRPWYNKEGGFLVPGRASKTTFLFDYLSDAWVDVHVGGSLSTQNRFMYDVGIGTRVAVVWPLQVGLYVRFQHLLGFGNDGSFLELTAGLTFSLGFRPVHSLPDADDDGVPDAIDRCPDTPRGTPVNAAGCEITEERKTPPPACSDTDLDGVCDGQDVCPDTPTGARVDARGCAEGETPPAE